MKSLHSTACFAILSSVFLMVQQPAMASEKELETRAVTLAREQQAGGYKLMTVEELQKAIDAHQNMLIVDTMPYEDSYKKNHIPGAVQFLFPVALMEQWKSSETANRSEADFAALLGSDKDKTIVFYCGFVKCTRSHNAALWAKKLGYKDVYRLPGGIMAWKDAGYAVKSVD